MTKKILSILFLGTWGTLLLGVILSGYDVFLSDAFYMITGFGWMITGTWLSIRTIRDENKKF